MDSSVSITLNKLLTAAAKRKASDIHFTVNAFPALRIDEDLIQLKEEELVTSDFTKALAEGILNEDQKNIFTKEKEITFVKTLDKKFRLKIHIFLQKQFISVSFQLIPALAPRLINLGLPKSVYSLPEKKSGLIIVCGPYGSGKTTTIAALVNEINKTRRENIVTIEQPIEYLFTNEQSLVDQRQVPNDVNNFMSGIEDVAESDVDVMVVGVNNEKNTIPPIVEFSHSGRLAIMGMDAVSSVQAVEEILAAFSEADKNRAPVMLAESLQAIICQRLVTKRGGGLVLASEVVIATDAVRSLISSGRIKQINTVVQSSRAEGMISLDQSLAELVKSGQVLIDRAIEHAVDPDTFRTIAKL